MEALAFTSLRTLQGEYSLIPAMLIKHNKISTVCVGKLNREAVLNEHF